MRYLVRYLPACNFLLNYLSLFYIQVLYLPILSAAGKIQTSIMLLKLWYINLENISEFSLIIVVGISSSCDAFDAPKFFISLIILSFVIWFKVNTGPLLIFLFIAKILGCLQYFNIAFKVGSLSFSIIESVWFFEG